MLYGFCSKFHTLSSSEIFEDQLSFGEITASYINARFWDTV